MTGYGRGQSESPHCQVTVDIRSVNHRFLDLKIRGAALDPGSEEKLRERIGKSVSRGALSVSIRIEQQGDSKQLRVDLQAAKMAYDGLQELRDSLGLREEVSLELLCKQPGVMGIAPSDDKALAEVGECALSAAAGALEQLMAMRTKEGKALRLDMESRLERLASIADTLAQAASKSPEDARTRLEERIGKLLKSTAIAIDESRLAQEVAITADRLDVSEEIVRVRSHLDQLEELLQESNPVGRRLDFLVQELGREFNTVTSKSQSARIARMVVDAKAEMEKIREQVQNIE